MTPADERILKLIAKWRASLELHAGYSKLSDDQYWLVQPWPKHQRPTAWVIQLAQQRLADLERIVTARVAAGDNSISEALELMSFMANLVGAQNVERFVPIAEPEQERPIAGLQGETPAIPGPKRTAATAARAGRVSPAAARPAAAAAKPAAHNARAKGSRSSAAARAPDTTDATGEMPPPQVATRADATSEMPALAAGSGVDATGEMPALPATTRPDATREMPALTTTLRADATAEMPEMGELSLVEDEPEAPLPDDKMDREILRDAVRLLGWGREWHELPEAIARMAGRPDKARIRRILKSHQAAIQREAETGSRPH
jgi:hypothetical protein